MGGKTIKPAGGLSSESRDKIPMMIDVKGNVPDQGADNYTSAFVFIATLCGHVRALHLFVGAFMCICLFHFCILTLA